MFLGLNVLGDSICSNTLSAKQSYDTVKIYGNSVIDGVHALNKELTDEELLSINTEPEWISETIFRSNFEDTLESGTIGNSDQIITQWAIRRKKPEDLLNPVIAILPYDVNSNAEYTDYTPNNKKEYMYTVSPVSGNGNTRIEGQGVTGVSFVDFYGWTLTSLDEIPTIFKFDMDIESDSFQIVKDMKLYQNNTKFPAFRFGSTQYRTSKLTTMPYEFNEDTKQYIIDDDLLNRVEAFINNGEEKLLKSPSGTSMKVITHDFSYKYMDEIISQPYKITFSFVQTGEIQT